MSQVSHAPNWRMGQQSGACPAGPASWEALAGSSLSGQAHGPQVQTENSIPTCVSGPDSPSLPGHDCPRLHPSVKRSFAYKGQ